MAGPLLPLFPLPLVLLPRTRLPLHIFEECYKEMIGEAIARKEEFGIVLAQGQNLMRTGCTAVVEKVLHRHEDGRLHILCGGRRRFSIEQIDTERTFLRAEVEFFDDANSRPPDPALVERACRAWASLQESGGKAPPSPREPQISFLLAQVSEEVDFRQTLLDLCSEAQRMERVAPHLEELVAKRRQEEDARRAAKVNGHPRHARLREDPE